MKGVIFPRKWTFKITIFSDFDKAAEVFPTLRRFCDLKKKAFRDIYVSGIVKKYILNKREFPNLCVIWWKVALVESYYNYRQNKSTIERLRSFWITPQADKILFSHSVTKTEYDALCFKYKAALLRRAVGRSENLKCK